MSVLIKGMEKPRDCGECHFLHTQSFEIWCWITEREDILYDAVPDWCPLVEVKTPHGRLIDADKGYDAMTYEMCGTGFQGKASYVLSSEMYTPTVIEAEGAEEL